MLKKSNISFLGNDYSWAGFVKSYYEILMKNTVNKSEIIDLSLTDQIIIIPS